MTEYDYSPEAWERHMENQNKIRRWVDTTSIPYTSLKNPFDPATPAPDAFLGLRQDDSSGSSDNTYGDSYGRGYGNNFGGYGEHRGRHGGHSAPRRRDRDGVYDGDHDSHRHREGSHSRPRTAHTSSHTIIDAGSTRPTNIRSQTAPTPRRASYDHHSSYQPQLDPTTTYNYPQIRGGEHIYGSNWQQASQSQYNVHRQSDHTSSTDQTTPHQPYPIYDYSNTRTQPQISPTHNNRLRSASVTYPPAATTAIYAPIPQHSHLQPFRPIIPSNIKNSHTSPPKTTRHRATRSHTAPIPAPILIDEPGAQGGTLYQKHYPVYPSMQALVQGKGHNYNTYPGGGAGAELPPPPHSAPVIPSARFGPPGRELKVRLRAPTPAPPTYQEKPPPLLKRLFTGLTGAKKTYTNSQSSQASQIQIQSKSVPVSPTSPKERASMDGYRARERDRGRDRDNRDRDRDHRDKTRDRDRDRGRDRDRDRDRDGERRAMSLLPRTDDYGRRKSS